MMNNESQVTVPSSKTITDFRYFLRREIERRRVRNRRYSIRAFARDLGIRPTRMISILNGSYGLSPKAAIEIGDKLALDPQERELFCKLVTARHARNRKAREAADLELKRMGKSATAISNTELGAVKELVDALTRRLLGKSIEEVDASGLLATLGQSSHSIREILETLKKI